LATIYNNYDRTSAGLIKSAPVRLRYYASSPGPTVTQNSPFLAQKWRWQSPVHITHTHRQCHNGHTRVNPPRLSWHMCACWLNTKTVPRAFSVR